MKGPRMTRAVLTVLAILSVLSVRPGKAQVRASGAGGKRPGDRHRTAKELDMRTCVLTVLSVLTVLTVPTAATAQIRASERSTLTQTVDGTVIRLDFARPRLRGRASILVVDAIRMRAEGRTFFRSANGVWLVDRVPPEFLRVLPQPAVP